MADSLCVCVCVVSIRAGACGINLTQANVVVLMEPCLNEAIEQQAIGRVHRYAYSDAGYRYLDHSITVLIGWGKQERCTSTALSW